MSWEAYQFTRLIDHDEWMGEWMNELMDEWINPIVVQEMAVIASE